VVEAGLRSQVEDRWRAAYQKAGSGALDDLREADPELVADDSQRLGAALQRVLGRLPEGGSALVVGHSPTNEAAILGLTGQIVPPLTKGAGVLVVAGNDGYEVELLGSPWSTLPRAGSKADISVRQTRVRANHRESRLRVEAEPSCRRGRGSPRSARRPGPRRGDRRRPEARRASPATAPAGHL
jgi:hypothetical protein